MCLFFCVGCLVGLCLSLKGALYILQSMTLHVLRGLLLAQTLGGGVLRLTSFLNALPCLGDISSISEF